LWYSWGFGLTVQVLSRQLPLLLSGARCRQCTHYYTHLSRSLRTPVTIITHTCHDHYTHLSRSLHTPVTIITHTCHDHYTHLSQLLHTPVTIITHTCHDYYTHLSRSLHTPVTIITHTCHDHYTHLHLMRLTWTPSPSWLPPLYVTPFGSFLRRYWLSFCLYVSCLYSTRVSCFVPCSFIY
jgi:hypothetical protein